MDRGTTNRMPLILMLRGSRFLASMTYCRGAVDIVLSHVLNSSASKRKVARACPMRRRRLLLRTVVTTTPSRTPMTTVTSSHTTSAFDTAAPAGVIAIIDACFPGTMAVVSGSGTSIQSVKGDTESAADLAVVSTKQCPPSACGESRLPAS